MNASTTASDVLTDQGFESLLTAIGRSLILASSDAHRLLALGLDEGRLYTSEAVAVNAGALVGVGPRLFVGGARRIARWVHGDPPEFDARAMPVGFYPRQLSFVGNFVADDAFLGVDGRPCFSDASGRLLVLDSEGVAHKEPSRISAPDGVSRPRSIDGVVYGVLRARCELVRVVRTTGTETIASLPGIPTGLVVDGGRAFVSLRTATAPEDDASVRALASKDADARAGVVVVDLASGRILHWMRWSRVVTGIRSIALVVPSERPLLVGLPGL